MHLPEVYWLFMCWTNIRHNFWMSYTCTSEQDTSLLWSGARERRGTDL